ncbi:Tyrosine recombinase XerC [subsurface metagenome]
MLHSACWQRSSVVEQRTHKLALDTIINQFIESRREGLSPLSIKYYSAYLKRARQVVGLNVSGHDITHFLKSLKCSAGGKHAYFRCLRTFYNWLYSRKSGYKLNIQDNPILVVDAPKLDRKILPSLTPQQLDYLIEQASCVRDKAIISLFADSGFRLTELANVNPQNIDWQNHLIKVRCKGNKEGLAPFGKRTEILLKQWLSIYQANGKLWDLNHWGISIMLRRLSVKTGLPCNPHTFRRTFASILAKRGVDSLHIMRLGRWESIQMVERYTKSVQFEDSLKLYSDIVN